MNPPSSRVGGDFNQDAVEAFRAAYAQQLMSPQDQDTDSLTGLPTNVVSNTSPWYEGVGLWRYPSGRGPDEDLRQPFNPESYLSDEILDEEDEEIGEIIDQIENLPEEG